VLTEGVGEIERRKSQANTSRQASLVSPKLVSTLVFSFEMFLGTVQFGSRPVRET